MKNEKISAVYKIVNEVTGDFYVGSSKNVKRRWANHKCSSTWKEHPNSKLYQDMKTYGVDKFRFQILCPVMPEYLHQVEQELIEMLNPTYNNYNAKGLNVERIKETNKKAWKKCKSRLCSYNGETLTLCALGSRLRKSDVEHPYIEAKKHLMQDKNK